MDLEQSVKDLQAQNVQLHQWIMNLFKGQEELKALLTKDMKNHEGIKDDQLKQLQAEMSEMRSQINGQLALIQNLELIVSINKLQNNRVGDQIISQPPVKQIDLGEKKMKIKEGKRQVADNPSVEERRPYGVVIPRVQQQHKEPKRLFTKINMPLSQALQRLLKMNLIALREPPQKPNISSPSYIPNARCAYHSDSPGHDTNSCWALKNKIQDLIDEGVLEFTLDGQIEFFYRPSNSEAARRIVRSDKFRKRSFKII